MKNTVYKNASVVTGLSVAERLLGFLYRIVLSRLIGAEGLGVYQVAHSIFSLLLTVGTGGIPITLSRMIAQSNAENKPKTGESILTAGLLLSLFFALPATILLWIFGGKTSFLFSDKQSFSVFRILLIGLCFSCVYAVLRGYFWGKKQFFLASILETVEEIAMVLIGVTLLRGATSPFDGAKKAAWASAFSHLLSCGATVLCFFALKGKLRKPNKTLKPLFNAAIPITSVRASGSLVNSAVAVLLPAMLVRAGVGEREALTLFGVVSGMVIPVLFTPSTLIGSLSLVLVPELSADYHKKNTERLVRNIERGLRFSFLIACALVPFFSVLGEEFGLLAFSNRTAGKIIAKSCVILLPMSLTLISTSMLNSVGFEKQTFLFFFVGAAAMLLCVLLLPPYLGVYAYVVGMGANYILTSLCNLLFLQKKCPIFQKRWGRVCVQTVFPALIGILPLSLLGEFLLSFLKGYLGELLLTPCVAVCMAISTLLYYLATRLLPLPTPTKKKRAKNG